MKYSKEQKRVIQTFRRRVQVLAYAGSGKTSTLLGRIKRLIRKGVESESILVVSFSKQAVRVLRDRLPTGGVSIKTVHAFGKQRIEAHYRELGYQTVPKLIQDKEVHAILKEALKKVKKALPKDESKKFVQQAAKNPSDLRLLVNFFALKEASRKSAKTLVRDNEAFQKFTGHLKTLKKVFEKFRSIKRRRSLLDYSDMVRLGLASLKVDEELPYRYLFVDEYQDCTIAQVQFLCGLAKAIPNLMVFGDPIQAIHGFAGGQYQNLVDVLKGTRTYELTESYRLTQRNAKFAATLVREAGGPRFVLKGLNGKGKKPTLISCETAYGGDQAVAEIVSKLLQQHTEPRDIAILARTNAQLHDVEQVLRTIGIGSVRRHRCEDTADVRHVLRMVRRLEKCTALGKLPTIPSKVIETATTARDIPDSTLATCRRRFVNASNVSSQSLASRYIHCRSIYMTLCGKKIIGKDRVADLSRWQATAGRFNTAKELKRHIACMGAAGKVQTATIHGAKGGEWKHVILVGCTDGSLPFFKAKTEAQLIEERNAIYVAATRVKEQLYMVHAPYTNARARKKFNELSRFLRPQQVERCSTRSKMA